MGAVLRGDLPAHAFAVGEALFVATTVGVDVVLHRYPSVRAACKEPRWDVRQLRQVLAMWAMSPEDQASRDDVAATLAAPRVNGALYSMFEQR